MGNFYQSLQIRVKKRQNTVSTKIEIAQYYKKKKKFDSYLEMQFSEEAAIVTECRERRER